MFRHDRGELERLAERLDRERARVALSRVRLARAGRRAFGRPLALLAPFTAGALVAAAAQHREPEKGGRFPVRRLFATATAAAGLVEAFREVVAPLLADLGRRAAAPDGPAPSPGPDVPSPPARRPEGPPPARAPGPIRGPVPEPGAEGRVRARRP